MARRNCIPADTRRGVEYMSADCSQPPWVGILCPAPVPVSVLCCAVVCWFVLCFWLLFLISIRVVGDLQHVAVHVALLSGRPHSRLGDTKQETLGQSGPTGSKPVRLVSSKCREPACPRYGPLVWPAGAYGPHLSSLPTPTWRLNHRGFACSCRRLKRAKDWLSAWSE